MAVGWGSSSLRRGVSQERRPACVARTKARSTAKPAPHRQRAAHACCDVCQSQNMYHSGAQVLHHTLACRASSCSGSQCMTVEGDSPDTTALPALQGSIRRCRFMCSPVSGICKPSVHVAFIHVVCTDPNISRRSSPITPACTGARSRHRRTAWGKTQHSKKISHHVHACACASASARPHATAWYTRSLHDALPHVRHMAWHGVHSWRACMWHPSCMGPVGATHRLTRS